MWRRALITTILSGLVFLVGYLWFTHTSPDSLLRDRGEKLTEYELGGVREYWLIDPERERADFYRLDAEGYYERAPVDAEGVYHSEAVPGFRLRVEWLWQEPLPKVLDVLREMELI